MVEMCATRVGAAQKSGIFWALDPDTGKVVWSQIVGPAGKLGGFAVGFCDGWSTNLCGDSKLPISPNTSYSLRVK
jgi:hypothetical protein